MIYEFIYTQKADFKITLLCRVCEVPRQCYYDWLKRRDGFFEKKHEEEALRQKILDHYVKSRCNYGAPKLTVALRNAGIHVSRKKVARLMVELGIRGACPRKSIRTTERDKSAVVSSDHVNRDFSANKVDELLVSDLTYIPTKEGWLFLVCILDVYSKRILGWSMATHMRVELFLDALRQLQITRGKALFTGTIFHDDRGSQYSAHEFRAVLKAMGMIQSMGSVGDSYDNALAENLWSLLKRESSYSDNFETIDEARVSIFDWINWYNNERIHSSIGYTSPIKFEEQTANLMEQKVA